MVSNTQLGKGIFFVLMSYKNYYRMAFDGWNKRLTHSARPNKVINLTPFFQLEKRHLIQVDGKKM